MCKIHYLDGNLEHLLELCAFQGIFSCHEKNKRIFRKNKGILRLGQNKGLIDIIDHRSVRPNK